MPLYVSDYMADTITLSNREHGAYLLSIMCYWQKGGALTSQELRDICGRDTDRISRFFIWSDNRWNHKRVDVEIKKALDKQEQTHDRAMKLVAARRSKGEAKI